MKQLEVKIIFEVQQHFHFFIKNAFLIFVSLFDIFLSYVGLFFIYSNCKDSGKGYQIFLQTPQLTLRPKFIDDFSTLKTVLHSGQVKSIPNILIFCNLVKVIISHFNKAI